MFSTVEICDFSATANLALKVYFHLEQRQHFDLEDAAYFLSIDKKNFNHFSITKT